MSTFMGVAAVVSRVDGLVSRVQHVLLRPGPDLVPATAVDGPSAWAAVAALYGVEIAAVERAGRSAADAELGLVFTPFEPFWKAVGAEYPLSLGEDLSGVIFP